MTSISTPVWTFSDGLVAEGDNAVRRDMGVFHQVLQHVPRWGFDRQVKEHEGNKGVRSLPMWTQFIALAYGQLSGHRACVRSSRPFKATPAALPRERQAH